MVLIEQTKPDSEASQQKKLSLCPAEYLVTDNDARQYVRGLISANLALYGAYFLSIAGIISPLLLFAIVSVTLSRWMIYVHELFHVRTPEKVDWFTLLLPLPLSPFMPGYREHRAMHMGHHRSPGAEDDPDAYHVRGSLFKAFLGAMTVQEQGLIHWIKENGISRQLAIGMAIRFAIFVATALVGGKMFLWFWLALRLVYGFGDFVLFRLVHYRNGEYGTFRIELPEFVIQLGELIFGKTVIRATINHDVHHVNPRIAAGNLPSARFYIMSSGKMPLNSGIS